MNVPDAAVEAVREALAEIDTATGGYLGYADLAVAAVDAAMPAIREHIAQELNALTDWHVIGTNRAVNFVRTGTR